MGSIIRLFNDVISTHRDKQLLFIGLILIVTYNSLIVIMSENIGLGASSGSPDLFHKLTLGNQRRREMEEEHG